MRHKVICTAGHIDHGKTSLVKALTGMDTDRLVEEKVRGITIDLGFGFYRDDVTIIDLPGHERFIRNMAAGAATVDFAILTVAADDGPMPQTLEHLDILNLLGVKDGMTVVTKTDLAEPDWVELVMEDMREKTAGTFLEGKPVLAVDSLSGKGIEEFRRALNQALDRLPPRPETGDYRQPVDRSFIIKGFGTVITGTVISGGVALKDSVEVLPGGKTAKVRGIQVHGENVPSAQTGDRAALNLTGLEKWEIQRGDVLAKPGLLKAASRLDCKVTLLKNSPPLRHRQRLRFHLGTAEIIGRILLLEDNLLPPGESMFAQLELEKPAAARRGDRFVFRTYSPQVTIGGGEVLMPAEEKHKRRQPQLRRLLSTVAQGNPKQIVLALLEEVKATGVSGSEIIAKGSVDRDDLSRAAAELEGNGELIAAKAGGENWYISPQAFESGKTGVLEFADRFHRKNPALPGFTLAQLKGEMYWDSPGPFLERALEELVSAARIVHSGPLYHLPGHRIRLSSRQKQLSEKILSKIQDMGLSALKANPMAEEYEVEVEEILDLLAMMEGMGDLVRLERDTVISPEAFRGALETLRERMEQSEFITLPEAVKVLGSSRRVTLALLDYLDKAGITERIGDQRRFKPAV